MRTAVHRLWITYSIVAFPAVLLFALSAVYYGSALLFPPSPEQFYPSPVLMWCFFGGSTLFTLTWILSLLYAHTARGLFVCWPWALQVIPLGIIAFALFQLNERVGYEIIYASALALFAIVGSVIVTKTSVTNQAEQDAALKNQRKSE